MNSHGRQLQRAYEKDARQAIQYVFGNTTRGSSTKNKSTGSGNDSSSGATRTGEDLSQAAVSLHSLAQRDVLYSVVDKLIRLKFIDLEIRRNDLQPEGHELVGMEFGAWLYIYTISIAFNTEWLMCKVLSSSITSCGVR